MRREIDYIIMSGHARYFRVCFFYWVCKSEGLFLWWGSF